MWRERGFGQGSGGEICYEPKPETRSKNPAHELKNDKSWIAMW